MPPNSIRRLIRSLALTCACLPGALLAQDTLYFFDGDLHIGRVVEQSPVLVAYKKASEPKGLTYRVKPERLLALKLSEESARTYEAFDRTQPGQSGAELPAGDRRESRRRLEIMLASDGIAQQEYSAGKSLRSTGTVFSVIAGAGLGYSLVQRIRKGSAAPRANTLLPVGSGTLGIASALMQSAGHKRMTHAVESYNGRSGDIDLKLGLTPSGAGWVMTF